MTVCKLGEELSSLLGTPGQVVRDCPIASTARRDWASAVYSPSEPVQRCRGEGDASLLKDKTKFDCPV